MIVTATCINDRLLSLHLWIEDLGDLMVLALESYIEAEVQEYYEIFN
jgi:hypothetical protein